MLFSSATHPKKMTVLTFVKHSAFFSDLSFCPQLLSYLKQLGDYALSKDVNVVLWLDCRASRGC